MGRRRDFSNLGLYHFVWRCNRRENLLFECVIKDLLIKAMSKTLQKYPKFRILGITIMDNHLHIVLKSKTLKMIESFSRSVGARFAPRYHYLQGTSGHIFGERYSLQPINDPLYFVVCMAYIFNNPVKAGMVKNTEDYQYSNFTDIYYGAKMQKYTSSKVACLVDNKARRELIGDRELIKITKELKKTPIDNKIEMEPIKRISMLLLQKKFIAYVKALSSDACLNSRNEQQKLVRYLINLHATKFQIHRVTGIGYYTVSRLADECFMSEICTT